MKPRTMTRQQLYELVWSTPMRDAARCVSISDVGLKKCAGLECGLGHPNA